MIYLGLLKTFGPYIAIALLLGAIAWMRGDDIKHKSERDAAQAQVKQVMAINADNEKVMAAQSEAAKANAAIATTLAESVKAASSRADQTRFILQEAKANDPQAKSWADAPIPDSLRGALSGTGAGGSPH